MNASPLHAHTSGDYVQDGVILGADTRSTAGTVVADKNCEKIHPITDKIFCCGAGTAADCEMVTGMVSSTMKLHQYATGRPARVVTVKTLLSQHLFQYQGYIGAALVLGGVDLNGPHLYSVRWLAMLACRSIPMRVQQLLVLGMLAHACLCLPQSGCEL